MKTFCLVLGFVVALSFPLFVCGTIFAVSSTGAIFMLGTVLSLVIGGALIAYGIQRNGGETDHPNEGVSESLDTAPGVFR